MAMLAWVTMGLAIWRSTIFLPDRFWGGIVGAFVGDDGLRPRGQRRHDPRRKQQRGRVVSPPRRA